MAVISLLNSPECPCPGTHYAACMEFIEGFTEFGFAMKESNSIEECKGINIILLSNHKINIEYLKRLNSVNPTAVYILWYYHNVFHEIPFKYFILTGEHFIYPPKIPEHIEYHRLNESISNFIPLYLRANEAPKNIGLYQRGEVYNGCFMGSGYKYDWSNVCSNVFYHDISRGLLDYKARRDIYLQSTIAFGFHNDNNIVNSHVTQRVFEGLTYGCVVISDNKAATDYTGGIVEYASCRDELREKVSYVLNDPEVLIVKQEQGYEWAKKFGTNRFSAKAFLDKIYELWQITYI
jgi:hypothetical protein